MYLQGHIQHRTTNGPRFTTTPVIFTAPLLHVLDMLTAHTDLFCDIGVQECGEGNEVDELFDQVSSKKLLSQSEMLGAKEEIPVCAEFSEIS